MIKRFKKLLSTTIFLLTYLFGEKSNILKLRFLKKNFFFNCFALFTNKFYQWKSHKFIFSLSALSQSVHFLSIFLHDISYVIKKSLVNYMLLYYYCYCLSMLPMPNFYWKYKFFYFVYLLGFKNFCLFVYIYKSFFFFFLKPFWETDLIEKTGRWNKIWGKS